MPNDQPGNGSTNGRTNGAHGPESEAHPGPSLTTRQGQPVHDNQNNRTVGGRGPTVMENYHFLEKISHFDRERRGGPQ